MPEIGSTAVATAAPSATTPRNSEPIRSASSQMSRDEVPINAAIAARLQAYAKVAGAISGVIGLNAFLGWVLHSEVLKSILLGHVAMKTNAAICLMMTGAALVLTQNSSFPRRRIAQLCCTLALVIGSLTVIEYAFASNLGIDQLLFHESVNWVGTLPPNRMAPTTAGSFVLLGLALLLINSKRVKTAQALAGIVTVFSLLTLLGYTYAVNFLYGLGFYGQMAFPMAIGLALLSTGLLCARTDTGFGRLLAAESTGGMMLRRLLPLAVLAPWLLGWISNLGSRLGLYESSVDDVLFAASLMLILTSVILWNAGALNRLDAERKRAEGALRRSRDQWELTFNCMSEGLSYHDLDYNIVGANDAFYNMLGRETLAGCKCYEVVHHMSEPPDYCPMRRTLASKQAESSEFFEPNLRRYLSVRTDPVQDRDGHIVRIVHVVNDITERKQAETAVQRLAAIVESSDDAIIGKDLDGHILSWNHGAEKMYGYTAAEVVGKSVNILCLTEADHDIAEMLVQIRTGQRVESLERPRMRKDGSRIDVSLTISPILDTEGHIVGASTIARDISERKRAEEERAKLLRLEQQGRRELEAKSEEIEKLNAELEERVRLRTLELEVSNKELEAFSYSVSHDLRAPLRSIDGFSQILLDEYGSKFEGEGRDFLQRVRLASQNMGQLIDSLLQLSRVSRSEMRRVPVDLSASARDIAAELRKTAPERQGEFIIADNMIAQADPKLLQVAIYNLLSNAWKFTSKRAQGRIEFGIVEQDGKPAYFVRDNGAGFDMAYANKLFGAFQRLHTANEFEGNGIGLATVHRIIRRHGGRIWAEGAPDQGATFYFTLS